MSITITQDYDNLVACIGSGQQVYIYSSNYFRPNFYVSLNVNDGLGFNRTYYLYPNPVNHNCYFNLDLLLDSFFKAPFPLNNINEGVNVLSYDVIYTNIRRFTLNATAYWTGGSENTGMTIYAIYNADRELDYLTNVPGSGVYGLENNIFPFINNKIYIHDGCRVLFTAFDLEGSIFDYIGLYNENIYTYTRENIYIFFNYEYGNFVDKQYIRVRGYFPDKYYKIVDTSYKKGGVMVYFWTTKGTLESYYFPNFTEVLSGVQRNVIKTKKGWVEGTNSIYSDYNSFGGIYTKQLQIQSDLLDDDDAKALSYLLTSPYIFFKFCDVGMDNVYYQGIIKDTNYDISSYKRNKYTTKQFTLDYKELKF